jgi:hypothetical protein
MFNQYIYGAYCLNPSFLALTQSSVDGCNLGRLVLIYLRPLLNSLIQIYDYACSLHEEVMNLFRDTPRFLYTPYSVKSGHFYFGRSGPR